MFISIVLLIGMIAINSLVVLHYVAINQGLSQDLETGCLKLAIVKILGVEILKWDHIILRFHP